MDLCKDNMQRFLADMSGGFRRMESTPLYLTLGLTETCNFQCVFCVYCGVCARRKPGRDEMSLHTLENLAEYFPAASYICPSLRGEPFLYTHFDRFIELMKHGGADRMQLTNNGSQLHKYDIKKLEGVGVVSVSFDGADKKTLEALRCGANFEQLLANMEQLRAELPGTQLHMAVVACRLNLRQLADIYCIAREKKFDWITFNTVYGPSKDRVIQLLRLRESDRAELESQMERIREWNADNRLVVSDMTTFDGFEDGEPWDYDRIYGQLQELKNTVVPYLDFDENACITQEDRRVHTECRSGKPAGWRLPYCTSPFLVMSVLPSGKVEPCCAAYAVIDDLTGRTVEDVWNGEPYGDLREAMFDWDMLPDYCRQCKVFMRYDYLNEYVDYLKGKGVRVEEMEIPPHFYPKREFIRDEALWERIQAANGESAPPPEAGNSAPEEKSMEEINTKEYWEDRFAVGDWDKYDGELQSGFFSELALSSFPDWLKKELSRQAWTVSDWGCAEGRGTAVLARRFPKCQFTGVDFSATAIEKASRSYPYCAFQVRDLNGEMEEADVIFCSNVLEHMKAPYELFLNILSKARQHAIFMVPLRDSLDLSEHFYIFEEGFFPLRAGQSLLSFFRVIDCEEMGTPYWPGQQLLLIYSNCAVYDQEEYQLSDLFSREDYLSLKETLKREREEDAANRKAMEDERQRLDGQIGQARQEIRELASRAEQEKQALLTQTEQEKQALLTQTEQEKQALLAQLEQEKQALLAQAEQDAREKQALLVQLEQTEEKRKELNLRAEGLEDERKLYQEKAEQLENVLQEKTRQLEVLEEEKNALSRSSARLLEQQNAAVLQIQAMVGSRLFRMVHFLNRMRRQGFHADRRERRKFRKWLFSRFRHMPDRDHRYNPMFALLDILQAEESAVVSAPVRRQEILPSVEPAAGELRKHLEEQGRMLDEALAGPMSAEAEKLRKVLGERTYKGVLVYPHVVFWEPLQTPQQLLRAFAREGWLCFFCEAPWVENACREVEANLFITYESDLLQALQGTHAAVLLTWLGSMAFVERIPDKSIWYHILDHLKIFPYYGAYYQRIHDAVVETAQTVSYVSAPLSEECGKRQDAVYLANAVNPEEMKNIHPEVIPADMAPILAAHHKIVGYYGYLAEWMDYELVRQMAAERPEYEFVFIGKAIHDVSRIESLNNVHLLGLKPYRELFEYAKFFDVAIIPFVIDEKMDCVSPIKFYEYLALGLPVVSSRMKELEVFAQQYDFICTAENKDEFLFYIDALVKPEIRKNAQIYGERIARQNSWSARARQMEPHLLEQDYTPLNQDYTIPDIILLAVIDYDFRHQRPQHFAQRFAKQGHRVFYVNANFANTYFVTEREKNLWQVTLPNEKVFSIHLTDWADQQADMRDALERLIRDWFIRDAVLVVDYPNWVLAGNYLRERYGFPVVTDYMDDFTGFLNPAEAMVRKNCVRLLEGSDAVVASSQFLYEIALKYHPDPSIVRNGTEYEYFRRAYQPAAPRAGRKVIGYYGAIAEWFHAGIVCRCAERFPMCDIVLVGSVTANRAELEKHKNIRLIGEVPYQQLLPWLESFDVCLIPFDTSTDLIKATNPVKFYEYLSAGKKIVATCIPELEPYKNRFVYLENDPEAFCGRVQACLDGTDELAPPEECLEFARENDWDCRAASFCELALRTYPKISIVVLCYNQLDYTMECVESILKKTAYPNYELILVDNHSSDGTAAYLESLEKRYRQIKIVLNQTNRGFAGGNNDGLAVADGDYLVLLNNDTIVTRGWLTGLLKHFQADEKVGLVGPVTNSISNEAQISAYYSGTAEIEPFAYEYTQTHMGEEYPHKGILAMFCLMISRKAYEEIGPLDENYGMGMFEDDDYTTAARKKGYRAVMAEDVFIHHYGSVSFKKLEDEEYRKLFEKNRRYFEEKWGVKWKGHTMR